MCLLHQGFSSLYHHPVFMNSAYFKSYAALEVTVSLGLNRVCHHLCLPGGRLPSCYHLACKGSLYCATQDSRRPPPGVWPFASFRGTPFLSVGYLKWGSSFNCFGRDGEQAKPHVLIVGPPLSGTTLLHQFLRLNFAITLGEAPWKKDAQENPTSENRSGCLIFEDWRRLRTWKEFLVPHRILSHCCE